MVRFTHRSGCLITQKQGPSDFAWDQTIPVASVINVLLKRRCITAFCSPVFDTTSPGAGRQTETAPNVRHGNLTPPRISPSCPHENGWTGVSLLPDGIVARQLVQLFCGRMGTARHLTLAVFYAGNPHRWVLAHPPESLSAFSGPSGNVFQSPDMTGISQCFSRNREKQPMSPL